METNYNESLSMTAQLTSSGVIQDIQIKVYSHRFDVMINNPWFKVLKFDIEDHSVEIDWNFLFIHRNYSEACRQPYVLVTNDQHSLKIFGTIDQLTYFHVYTAEAKFTFTKRHFIRQLSVVNDYGDYRVDKVTDELLGRQGFENIIFQKQVDDGEISMTYCDHESTPCEIVILKRLVTIKCPNILVPSSVFREENNNTYSYTYDTTGLETLRNFQKTHKDLSVCFVMNILEQLLQTLTVLEQENMIHNNLTLSDIYINTLTYEIYLAGFRYANYKSYDVAKSATQGYMAPEQISGSKLKTTSTNLYQLGIVIFQLLTLRSPFGSSNAEIMLNNQKAIIDHTVLSLLPLPVSEMISSLLATDPKKRGNPNLHLNSLIFTPNYKQKLSRQSMKLPKKHMSCNSRKTTGLFSAEEDNSDPVIDECTSSNVRQFQSVLRSFKH